MVKLQKLVRKDIKNFEGQKVREIVEESGSTKKAFNEIRQWKNLMLKLKDEEGNTVCRREEIAETATKFYEKLHKDWGYVWRERNEDREEEGTEIIMILK